MKLKVKRSELTTEAQRTRRNIIILLSVLSVSLWCMSGCGKIPSSHFYTLEASLASPPGAAAPIPVSVAVARFHAPGPLQQDRIVFRPGPNRVDFYEYHRWADPPADLVTRNMIQQLRNTGLFRSVTGLQGGPQAEYLLRGEIVSLEEVDSGESVSARVILTAQLVDTKTRSTVWNGRGAHEVSVSERSVPGIVQSLNEGLRQSLEQLTRSLVAHLQQTRPAN